MKRERTVAGLRCGQVLHLLPDFLEGSLPPGEVARVEEHLRGCDWCERFGGEYASLVASLRQRLREPPPPPEAVRQRLRERLRREPPAGAG